MLGVAHAFEVRWYVEHVSTKGSARSDAQGAELWGSSGCVCHLGAQLRPLNLSVDLTHGLFKWFGFLVGWVPGSGSKCCKRQAVDAAWEK